MNEEHEHKDDCCRKDNKVDSKLALFLKTKNGKYIGLAVGAVILFTLATMQVYSRPVTDGFVRTLSNVIPYPALSVNGTTVSIKEFLIEYDALVQYFSSTEGEVSPPADQLEVMIAETLTNKKAMQQLATERGLELDSEKVEAYYQSVIAGQQSEELFESELKRTFGWTQDEFKERIVESIVLALQMGEAVLSDTDLQIEKSELAQQSYERVVGGEAFAVVAKDVHSGFPGLESDLGFVKLSNIPPTWAEIVNALEVGGITEVLDLPEGYAIFRLEERIDGDTDTQLHLMTITVPKTTLEEVVNDYIEAAKIKRYFGEE
ncbi:MAG: peptidyl-prolyl cis-trans isomerase [Parcubacteria group bacterium]|nr:peptidyl-prolyl cis-trans isomerase [Parcubacteria group bacterium]